MGYRILYGNGGRLPSASPVRAGRIVLLTVMAAAAFLAAVRRFWPQGTAVLEVLAANHVPGELRSRLELLAMELQCGTDLGSAVAAFCQDVVQLGLTCAG